jgi:hypothetical protein
MNEIFDKKTKSKSKSKKKYKLHKNNLNFKNSNENDIMLGLKSNLLYKKFINFFSKVWSFSYFQKKNE